MSVQPTKSSQQTPNTNTPTCSGKHTTRLLIGEGNFSFAEALIKKHDTKYNHGPKTSLAHAIIATELKSTISCEDCGRKRFLPKQSLSSATKQLSELNLNDGEKNTVDEKPIQCKKCSPTTQRINCLRDKGADVRLGFDGLKIKDQLPDQRFKRIHWNIPHDGQNITGQTLPPIIKDFFKSCSSVQDKGDRIHIAIPYPSDYRKHFYEGYVYDISTAAAEAGYSLWKKRKFGGERYPGYIHVKTNENEPADIMKEGAREFVFIKIPHEAANMMSDIAKKISDTAKQATGETELKTEIMAQVSTEVALKKYSIKEEKFYQKKRSYYECSTDDDSSGYTSS
jgi:hypothetical protein